MNQISINVVIKACCSSKPRWLICFVFLFLLGCDSLPWRDSKDDLIGHIDLLHSALPLTSTLQQQQLLYQDENEKHSFQGMLQIDEDLVTWVVLNDLGNRVTTLTYDGDKITLDPENNPFLQLPFRSLFAAVLSAQVIPPRSSPSFEPNEGQVNRINKNDSDFHIAFTDNSIQIRQGAIAIAQVNHELKQINNGPGSKEKTSHDITNPAIHFIHYQRQYELWILSSNL